ncbi:MAG: hypothetical protein COZ70_01630 [Deltaproteobacteria bacterium CG_4_8_14_3_um_filter_51_11]|nr:MAG: hypothetical protein AUK25_00250 [Desulfobacteraceae bacterium CG2_30_51_40]PIX20828.1 MAG: hypothetical protein COZ70_01630 [Deltaproteobacteria bacterium CG_4_8_14_3_um_filter_51_11]PJB37411.1 MAG: hypothetical protein CO107_04880 [Deltaproteobacteria bacterium CG_4_9_14_3_um_filter_51_14]
MLIMQIYWSIMHGRMQRIANQVLEATNVEKHLHRCFILLKVLIFDRWEMILVNPTIVSR